MSSQSHWPLARKCQYHVNIQPIKTNQFEFVSANKPNDVAITWVELNIKTKHSVIQGYVEDLLKLKTVNPDLKLLFSIVDNNGSFSTVVANETLRQDLVKHSLDIVTSHNYDGIDIDWEFPKDKDKVKVNAN